MADHVSATLLLSGIAVPLWALSWASWSGRVRLMSGHTYEIAVTVLPAAALGVTLVALSIATGQSWLSWVGPAAIGVGFVLSWVQAIAEPLWLQPAWYREEQAVARDPRGRGEALTSPAARRPIPPEGLGAVHLDRAATMVTSDTDRPLTVSVRGGRRGRLYLLDRHVAFVQDEVERRIRAELEPVVLGVADLTHVEVVGPPAAVVRWWRRGRRDARTGRRLRLATPAVSLEFVLAGPDEVAATIAAR
jgi:hypothetical protein